MVSHAQQVSISCLWIIFYDNCSRSTKSNLSWKGHKDNHTSYLEYPNVQIDQANVRYYYMAFSNSLAINNTLAHEAYLKFWGSLFMSMVPTLRVARRTIRPGRTVVVSTFPNDFVRNTGNMAYQKVPGCCDFGIEYLYSWEPPGWMVSITLSCNGDTVNPWVWMLVLLASFWEYSISTSWQLGLRI